MQKVISTIGILLITAMAWADCTITGRVADNATREAIDFANVSITKSSESVPSGGSITDTNGRFRIEHIDNGEYTLVVSFMGYREQRKTLSVKGKTIDIGTILLSEDTQALQEVEVVGQGATMRFELDKKVFTVDQNVMSAGANVSEVLENIPSVDVDQEGNISLRNSEDVEIWINGKPAGLNSDNRADILRQMPAESIKQIELITNPSAKYSPEGTAGIINLVMKEDRKAGYYGSVTTGIEYGLAEPWNIPPGGNIGFNLNFSKGIVDGYVNAGYRIRTSNGGSNIERLNIHGTGQKDTAAIPAADKVSYLTKHGQNNNIGGGIFLRAGLNIRASKHSSVGISGFGMVSDPKAFREHNRNTRRHTPFLRPHTRRQWLASRGAGTGGLYLQKRPPSSDCNGTI